MTKRELKVLAAIGVIAASLVAGSGSTALGAREGGTPTLFVLGRGGRVVVVDPSSGRSFATTIVSHGATTISAAGSGTRLLVADPTAGSVQQLNGLRQNHRQVFRVGRPVAVAFAYGSTQGFNQSRYAFVLSATRKALVTIDFAGNRVASTMHVAKVPETLAVAETTLWVGYANSRFVTAVDVTRPERPRVLGSIDTGATVSALAAAPGSSVIATFAGNAGLALLDSGLDGPHVLWRRHVAGGVRLAATDFTGRVWALRRDRDTALLLDNVTGLPITTVQVPRNTTVAMPVGSWMTFARGTTLTVLELVREHHGLIVMHRRLIRVRVAIVSLAPGVV